MANCACPKSKFIEKIARTTSPNTCIRFGLRPTVSTSQYKDRFFESWRDYYRCRWGLQVDLRRSGSEDGHLFQFRVRGPNNPGQPGSFPISLAASPTGSCWRHDEENGCFTLVPNSPSGTVWRGTNAFVHLTLW